MSASIHNQMLRKKQLYSVDSDGENCNVKCVETVPKISLSKGMEYMPQFTVIILLQLLSRPVYGLLQLVMHWVCSLLVAVNLLKKWKQVYLCTCHAHSVLFNACTCR